jgi:hypothetical protein
MKCSVLAAIGSVVVRPRQSFRIASFALPSLLMLLLSLFSFNGRAVADSTATANTFLNFGSATFSGPVAPSTGIGFGGDLSGDATVTQAAGYDLSSNSFFYGGVEGVVGWGPATSTLQIGPANFSVAAAGSDLIAISTIAGIYSVYAQVDRLGTILSTDGNIDISIPYTFSTSMSDCVCFTSTQVYLELYTYTSAQGYTPFGAVGAVYDDQFGAVSNYSAQGVLSLELSGLAPGTYNFDAGAASSATNVPEPSTLLLLGTALLAIGGTSLRKQFA